MNKTLLSALLIAGSAVGLASTAQAENAMYSCTDANGTVALTNVPTSSRCEQLFSYAAPAPSAPAATGSGASGANSARPASAPAAVSDAAASASADDPGADTQPAKDVSKPLIAQRRDDVIQQKLAAIRTGQPVAGTNAAVSRRYLMTNRVDYQRAIGMVQP